MLIKWSRGNSASHVAQHFKLSEFECKCLKCEEQMIDTDLLDRLDALRELVGAAILIHSGYRCAEHNKAVGGEKKSKHLLGLAADISSDACTMEELAKLCEVEFSRIGVAKTFCHVDVYPGNTKWVYK